MSTPAYFFKRNPASGILLTVAGCILAFTTFLQSSTGNPALPITLLAAIVNLGGGIWFLSTNYASIIGGVLKVQASIFSNTQVPLDKVKAIEEGGRRKLNFQMEDNSVISITLAGMTRMEGVRLTEVVTDLCSLSGEVDG